MNTVRNASTFRRAARLAVFLVLGGAGLAAAEDLQDLVKKQGEQIEQLQKELSDLKTGVDSPLDRDIEAYLAATENAPADPAASTRGPSLFGGRVRVGGYFSLEFRDDGDNSTMEFDAHRLVPKIQADVAEGITFETEIEIEGGGADASFLGDNEILVEYAELVFEILEDKLEFRVGLILVPWGRFNLYHDDPLNDLTDRPLVSRRIAAVAFDQPGIAVNGTLEAGEGWFIDYDVALVQGFADGFSTNGGVRDARQSFRSDNNDNKQVFGRFVLSPPVSRVDTLDFGASFAYGKHDDAGNLANYGYGIDVFVKRGPFEFIAEYMNLRIEQPAGAPPTDPRRMDGWYAEFGYHFFPASWRGKHKLFTDESTFTVVVRIEAIDLNHSTDGSAFRDDLEQISIGVNFRPVERTVIKVSYTFVDSDQTGFDSGSSDRFLISWASYF